MEVVFYKIALLDVQIIVKLAIKMVVKNAILMQLY
jgi:hypothetical protein